MDKQQFCAALRARLAGLPEADITSSIEYYCEMIDDRIEDGVPETVAVAAVGSVDEIAEQILMDTPMTKLVKARMKPKRALKAWEIVLIAVGSPVWLPILIAIAAVVLSVYITLWAIIVSLYAVVLSVAVAAIACLIGGFVLQPLSLPGILLGIGAAFVWQAWRYSCSWAALLLPNASLNSGSCSGRPSRVVLSEREENQNEIWIEDCDRCCSLPYRCRPDPWRHRAAFGRLSFRRPADRIRFKDDHAEGAHAQDVSLDGAVPGDRRAQRLRGRRAQTHE